MMITPTMSDFELFMLGYIDDNKHFLKSNNLTNQELFKRIKLLEDITNEFHGKFTNRWY